MKDQFQTEDTLNNKKVEGFATENLKCIYLSMRYFVQTKNFRAFLWFFGTNIDMRKPVQVEFYIYLPRNM